MSDEYKPEAWRMNGYYPESYAKFMAALGIGIDYDDSDYDRYEAEFRADLAAHDAEIRADAWDDGWAAGQTDPECNADNPYRTPRPPAPELIPGVQAALDALSIRRKD